MKPLLSLSVAGLGLLRLGMVADATLQNVMVSVEGLAVEVAPDLVHHLKGSQSQAPALNPKTLTLPLNPRTLTPKLQRATPPPPPLNKCPLSPGARWHPGSY